MASGGVNTPVPGYPQDWGTKKRMLFDHTGPKSYANVLGSAGAGDVILALDLGLGGFEDAGVSFSGYSASGNFIAVMTVTAASLLLLGVALIKVTLQWYTTTAAFGAKSTEVANATDLSAESVRISAVMI